MEIKNEKSRRIRLKKKFVPLPVYDGDEFYPNGIFNFNISRMLEHIASNKLLVQRESINLKDWYSWHMHHSVNEDHLPTVDVTKPIIQAEIRPGGFEIIDGNHRVEKAYRDGLESINSYKIFGEQLIPYFREDDGYRAFVSYWNEKVKSDVELASFRIKEQI